MIEDQSKTSLRPWSSETVPDLNDELLEAIKENSALGKIISEAFDGAFGGKIHWGGQQQPTKECLRNFALGVHRSIQRLGVAADE